MSKLKQNIVEVSFSQSFEIPDWLFFNSEALNYFDKLESFEEKLEFASLSKESAFFFINKKKLVDYVKSKEVILKEYGLMPIYSDSYIVICSLDERGDYITIDVTQKDLEIIDNKDYLTIIIPMVFSFIYFKK